MKKLGKLLLASLITAGIVGCGGNTTSSPAGSSSAPTSNPVETSSDNNSVSAPVSSEAPVVSSTIVATESAIKSLTAVSETVEVKIGETPSTAGYYELVGFKSLTAKQKKVTITSSNPEVLSISSNYKQMTAVSLGSAVVTVVSDVDTTKSCSFTVNVTDAFFDRTVSSLDAGWDIEHEMDETNPYIKVNTDVGAGVYIKGSDGLKWFVETEITVHAVSGGELWPKFGIVANTTTNTTETTEKISWKSAVL